MKKIKQKFVTYPIAVLLNELGFNEPCLGNFGNKNGWLIDIQEGSFNFVEHQNSSKNEYTISAPLWQDAIEWMKGKRVLVSELWDGWEVAKDGDDFVYYKTKEEAIKKGLEILKEEQNENRTN